MDNEKQPDALEEEKWLEELLASPDPLAFVEADLAEPAKETPFPEPPAEPVPPVQEPTVPDPIPAPIPEPAPEPETFKDDEFRAAFGEGEELNQVFSDQPLPAPEPERPEEPETDDVEEPEEDAPMEKGRPKRKSGYGLLGIPHILSTVIWLAIIVVIGVSIGRMIWLVAADVLGFNREPITMTFTIAEGDDIDAIASKLRKAGLIDYEGLFKLYCDITDADEKIVPGTYTVNDPTDEDNLNIVYDYMALVSLMSPHSSGLVVVDDLRIPEGYTCAQIFQLLEDNNVCTVETLEEYAANGELDEYWFLEGVKRGDKYCLEGYLFPDTYDFYENDDPERVLEKMLDAFDYYFTDTMRSDLEALNDRLAEMMEDNGYGSDYINEHIYTIREVVIIASMIEKETANNLESFTVSSVIYNRLTNAGKFPYLNIDATIVYALGGKSDLTEEDLKIDSPYNTYTNPGLCPGPISNPSQNSLAAALDPEETDYYYYAFDPNTEEHHFSKTYDDHLEFLKSLEGGE